VFWSTRGDRFHELRGVDVKPIYHSFSIDIKIQEIVFSEKIKQSLLLGVIL
jgi:hypothetical protein